MTERDDPKPSKFLKRTPGCDRESMQASNAFAAEQW
jgi:hypothetical protein